MGSYASVSGLHEPDQRRAHNTRSSKQRSRRSPSGSPPGRRPRRRGPFVLASTNPVTLAQRRPGQRHRRRAHASSGRALLVPQRGRPGGGERAVLAVRVDDTVQPVADGAALRRARLPTWPATRRASTRPSRAGTSFPKTERGSWPRPSRFNFRRNTRKTSESTEDPSHRKAAAPLTTLTASIGGSNSDAVGP